MTSNTHLPMQFNATFLLTTLKENQICQLQKTSKLPFMPTIGMMIDCSDGQPRLVESVTWDCTTTELKISYEFDDKIELETLISAGRAEEETF